MRSRALLIGAGVAAVATVAILLWPRSTADHESETEATEAGRVVPASGTSGSTPKPPDEPDSDDGEEAGAEAPQTGGVRDHRGQEPTHPRPRHLPGQRPRRVLQAPIIRGLRQTLRPEIKKCSDQYAKDLPENAVIQGSIRVTVQAGVLSVVEAKVDQRGVPETSPLIECARKAFAAATVQAEGHDDVESHMVRLPFPVPVK